MKSILLIKIKLPPFVLLITVKMPKVVGILIFISRINFMPSSVEQ